ncbi:MAG: hypothetical protein RLP44_05525 [Aggregatilineales bacterium]
MPKLIVETYPELMALHKALLRVRFADPPIDPLIPASPYLAKIANEIIELLHQHEIERNRLDFMDWHVKIDPNGQVWTIAKRNVIDACGEFWNSWTSEQKRENSRIFLSPFQYSEDVLDKFVREIDELTRDELKFTGL